MTSNNKTKGTITVYTAALDKLVGVIGDRELSSVTRRNMEAFVSEELERLKPATVSIDYRALQQFWKWAVNDGEVAANPMDGMRPPRVPLDPPPVMTDAQMRDLLAACSGNTFEDRRDLAIVRVFMSTGVRLRELTSLTTDKVSVADRRATVFDPKKRSERTVRFSLRAANAIERYQRVRRRHRLAALPELWIGDMGAITPNGVYQVIRRRARVAGFDLNPHRFRHTFAHRWMAAGGGETDLQNLAGWQSSQMLRRYGASAANERALSAYDRIASDDIV
jgi:site-specific recombinase XerD